MRIFAFRVGLTIVVWALLSYCFVNRVTAGYTKTRLHMGDISASPKHGSSMSGGQYGYDTTMGTHADSTFHPGNDMADNFFPGPITASSILVNPIRMGPYVAYDNDNARTTLGTPVVFEDFSSEPVDFSEDPYFSLSNGRLFFHGDRFDGGRFVIWVGGSNPGDEFPAPDNSNYFENFEVSVDTNWEAGADNYGYGIVVCTQINSDESIDSIRFVKDKSGWYTISKALDGNSETLVGWTRSSLISPDGQKDTLSIKKVGPYFHFFINQVEVQRRIVEGFHGGGVGVRADHRVDASFDNFTVTKLTEADIEDDNNDVFEDFNTGAGGFGESDFYSVSYGRYVFRGDRTDNTYYHIWYGGFNPYGLETQEENTNYFHNFTVSVDTFWEGGARNYVYGLRICNQKNGHNVDYVRFMITDDQYYVIQKAKNGNYSTLVDWTMSPFIRSGGQKNKLSIEKYDHQCRFFINDFEVEQVNLTDFEGGAIGVAASMYVDVSFDNFRITLPGAPPLASAGDDQTVNEGETVTLDGSGSISPEEFIEAYQWFQIVGSPVVVSDAAAVGPTFTAPDVGLDGNQTVFQLVVTAENRLHATDLCTVNVNWVDALGDIDKNGFVDLKDVIIVLQVLLRMNPENIRPNYALSVADVDGDGKIGLAELIYILNDLSAL